MHFIILKRKGADGNKIETAINVDKITSIQPLDEDRCSILTVTERFTVYHSFEELCDVLPYNTIWINYPTDMSGAGTFCSDVRRPSDVAKIREMREKQNKEQSKD